MSILFSVYVLALFVVLTPGILLRLPKKGSKTTVALVHALVFAVILAVSGHVFWKHGRQLFEGFTKTRGSNPGSNPGSNKKKVTNSEPTVTESKPTVTESKPTVYGSSSKNGEEMRGSSSKNGEGVYGSSSKNPGSN